MAPNVKRRLDKAIERGDTFSFKTRVMEIPMSVRFDDFVASTAYALRTKMTYRKDGGRLARAMVRASGDLQIIHDFYLNHTNKTAVKMVAFFFRRRDKAPTGRWMMWIRFDAPGQRKQKPFRPPPQKKKGDLLDFLDRAEPLVEDIPGERGIRLGRLLTLIKIAGYKTGAKKLWVYAERPALMYASWRTDDDQRKTMTMDTNNHLPFNGSSTYAGQWRIYPIKSLANRYQNDWTDRQLKDKMVEIDRLIANSAAVPEKAKKGAGMGGGTLFTPWAKDFMEHIGCLQLDEDHLYGVTLGHSDRKPDPFTSPLEAYRARKKRRRCEKWPTVK